MGEAAAEVEGGMAVLDFDMLCATVALQTQGISAEKRRMMGEEEDEEEELMLGGEFGGVQRMWEGEVMDCFEDRRIAIEAACCPCYRYGMNMRRANLGHCFLQAAMYSLLVVAILSNFIAFWSTRNRLYLYMGIAFTVSFGLYLGYFRSRIRKQFNIKGGDGFFDGCVYHIVCPCCTLSQEARTLEINNVQDGVWHGRGDTVCIGSGVGSGAEGFKALPIPPPPPPTGSPPDPCSMGRGPNGERPSRVQMDPDSDPLCTATTSSL